MKRIMGVLSILIGASSYIYMIVSTINSTGDGVSFTTFLLWGMLAWIASVTMWRRKANPIVPAIYGTGATVLSLVLLSKGASHWSTFDTIVAILVMICIVLWITSGARRALIMSVIAATVAVLPFMIMTWRNPVGSPVLANCGFFFANILSLGAAKSWRMEDSLYFGTSAGICALLVLPWLLM